MGKISDYISKEQYDTYRNQGMSPEDIASGIRSGSIQSSYAAHQSASSDMSDKVYNIFSNIDTGAFRNGQLSAPSLQGSFMDTSAQGASTPNSQSAPNVPNTFADLRNNFEPEENVGTAPRPVVGGFRNPVTGEGVVAPGLERTEENMQNNWINSDAATLEYMKQAVNGLTPEEQQRFYNSMPSEVSSLLDRYIANQENFSQSPGNYSLADALRDTNTEISKIEDRIKARTSSTYKDPYEAKAAYDRAIEEEYAKNEEYRKLKEQAERYKTEIDVHSRNNADVAERDAQELANRTSTVSTNDIQGQLVDMQKNNPTQYKYIVEQWNKYLDQTNPMQMHTDNPYELAASESFKNWYRSQG